MSRCIRLLVLSALCLCTLVAAVASTPAGAIGLCGVECRNTYNQCRADCAGDTTCIQGCSDDYTCCVWGCEGFFCP